MYDFKQFILHPKKFSSQEFFIKEKKDIDDIQKKKLVTVNTKNPEITFSTKGKQKLYDKLPYFVDIETILKNKKRSYIVPGGIRAAGARYPDFFINSRDVKFMSDILEKSGVLSIPIKNWKKACTKIVEIIQYSLNTKEFNDIKDSRWVIFDYESDSFRDLCMNTNSYNSYKNKLIPTSISMLLFLFGDCREHNILLLYFMRIYFHHNDKEDRYFVTSLYSKGGFNSGVKRFHFKSINFEHIFSVVIDKKEEEIISVDALESKTKILKLPPRQINNTELIIHKNYYESGFYYLKEYKDKKYLFKLVDWFSNQKMEYINDTSNYVYGIKFKKLDFSLWFDKKFHEKIKTDFLDSRLCRA